jgi:hypothetical protein
MEICFVYGIDAALRSLWHCKVKTPCYVYTTDAK